MPSGKMGFKYSIKGPGGAWYTPEEYAALTTGTPPPKTGWDVVQDMAGSDEREKAENAKALESDYAAASSALEGARISDVGEYSRTSPFAKKAALARLTGRGLGRSLMGNVGSQDGVTSQLGGYGSGRLRETDIGITKGLEDIMSNYQNLGQGLERQKLGESINLDDFYRNLAMARSSAASKKAGLTDILGLAPAVGSLFI